MNTFATMTAKMRLDIQEFAEKMKEASSMTNKFAKDMSGEINEGLTKPADKSKFKFKDVSRIVQGIVISKTFYSGLNAIRQCTDAVWEFAQELEYAKIAYTNLFGDVALADEFLNVLKDFAAETPFSFKESEASAKRLLAYGIQYENVMYVMQGVLAASSMQGNPQVIESVSRALGQIYTKGRLMNEEMRQLAEAGIPAYEILQQKLGLTQEQLQNLGRQGIPASKAINALVDGMNERFGGVVQASSKTLTGIISNIKDNAVMLVSGAFEPLITTIKSGLNVLGQFLFKMREIFELKGLGGVFEAIFPPEMQGMLRQFAANFILIHQAVIRLAGALLSALNPILQASIMLFNMFGPILISVANALSAIIRGITGNAQAMRMLAIALAAASAMWVVFKAKALATTVVSSVIQLIARSLAGLSTMLSIVVAHPFWALMIGAVVLIGVLSGGFSKLTNAINGMFKSLTSFNGINPDKVLLPSQKDRANDLNKFNEALDGTKDSMDDLADSTGKATKAAKGLLSFDEVFKLNEPDEGTGNGIQTDTDFEVPDLSGLSGEAFIPEIPDFKPFAENFVGKLVESLKEKLIGAGVGAIIGAALGSLLGGPVGAKLGLVAGALAGWFWNDFADALGLTDEGKIAIPIAAGIGGAIGGIAGGPIGVGIGVAIGGLVGWLVDSISRGLNDGDWSKIGYPIGIGIGGAIGAVVGGPVGAVIGGAIGALVGGIVDLIVSNWDGISGWFKDAWSDVTEFCSKVGGSVGKWLSGTVSDIGSWVSDVSSDISQGATDWYNSIVDFCSKAPGEFSKFCSDTISGLGQFFSDASSSAAKFVSDTISGIGKFFSDISSSFMGFVGTSLSNLSSFSAQLMGSIGTTMQNIWSNISSSWTNICNTVSGACSLMYESVSQWFLTTAQSIGSYCSTAWNTVSQWFNNIVNTITTTVTQAYGNVASWFGKMTGTISSSVSSAASSVGSFFSNMYSNISSAISNMYSTVSNGINNIYRTFANWISNLWDNVFNTLFGWIDTGISKLNDFFGLSNKAKNTDTGNSGGSGGSGVRAGHATGGVFNREHVARFAEGNKAEAIIPLENASAMQPFVDAVSNGITASLMPIVANMSGSQNQMQPLYVGTLIADERSLKELQRKMQVIQIQEDTRRGR